MLEIKYDEQFSQGWSCWVSSWMKMAHDHVAHEFKDPPTWNLANRHLLSKVTGVKQCHI